MSHDQLQRVQVALNQLMAIVECQGWAEAILEGTATGNVTVWAGPRLYGAIGNLKAAIDEELKP